MGSLTLINLMISMTTKNSSSFNVEPVNPPNPSQKISSALLSAVVKGPAISSPPFHMFVQQSILLAFHTLLLPLNIKHAFLSPNFLSPIYLCNKPTPPLPWESAKPATPPTIIFNPSPNSYMHIFIYLYYRIYITLQGQFTLKTLPLQPIYIY